MKADIKIIITKIILWIIVLVLFVLGINIGLWKTGALEEAVEKYRKEHATTQAAITTLPPVRKTTAAVITTTQTASVSNGGFAENSFVADFTVVNKWNGHYQYGVIIENKSKITLDTWEINAEIPHGCEIFDSWNCNLRIEDNRVIVTPMDYNSKLEPGGKITNIGIVFASETEMFNFQHKVDIEDMVKESDMILQTIK